MHVAVGLFYQNVNVANGSSPWVTGRTFVQANAATGCAAGSYYGHASGTVFFPPGFVPSSGYAETWSPTVNIVC